MIIARQSTARTVMVGPVLDADGAAVTDCVVADFEGSVNGGDPAALNGSATLTHRGVGFYSLALTATDLGTVGSFEVLINDTTNACPIKEITVIEEAVYDGQFAASAAGYLQSTTAGRTLDVSAGGEAGIDWANVGSPTTVVGLSGTTIKTATDVETDTQNIQSRIPASLSSAGNITADVQDVNNDPDAAASLQSFANAYTANSGVTVGTGGIAAGAFGTSAITAAALAPDAGTEIATTVWALATRTLTSLSGLTADANVTQISGDSVAADRLETMLDGTGGNNLTLNAVDISAATGVAVTITSADSNGILITGADGNSAIDLIADGAGHGIGSSSLGTGQVFGGNLSGNVGGNVTGSVGSVTGLTTSSIASAVFTTAMTESYRSAGATATLAQGVYELIAHMGESSISSTTKTLKKLDGSTTAKTYTLDSGSSPTSITETT
jgi:hypothetical protein